METQRQKRRWRPVVLGLSLALNLAVVAAVAGAAWRFHDGETPRGHQGRGGAPYIAALDREDRRAIREEIRRLPGARRSQLDALLEGLKAEPFDPETLRAALTLQRDQSLRRHEAASAAWLRRITQMTPEERGAYIGRLEDRMATRPRRHDPAAD